MPMHDSRHIERVIAAIELCQNTLQDAAKTFTPATARNDIEQAVTDLAGCTSHLRNVVATASPGE